MALKTVNNAADEPYAFDPAFERALTYYACTHEWFWQMSAHALDPALLGCNEAKLLVTAAGAIARDTGRPPCSTIVVIQRLHRWMADGKYTQDDLFLANDYLDAAISAGLPDVDSVLSELVPVLQRRLEFDALETGLKEYQGGSSLKSIVPALEKAHSLGRLSADVGTAWGPQSAARTLKERCIEKLALYVPEIDDLFIGGFGRGTMTAFLGDTGAGKSLALCHAAVAAAVQGLNVAVATLEVPVVHWNARVHACAVGIETNEVIYALDEAIILQQQQEFARRVEDHYGYPCGGIHTHEFPAGVTSPRDVINWVERMERDGPRFDVLVVDYADKLRPSHGKKKAGDEAASTYSAMGSIYDELFNWGKGTHRWTYTATQAKTIKDPDKHVLTENDCADSKNKSRILDQLITLNPRDDFQSLLWFIAKARYNGCRGQKIGPLPTAFGIGRVSPVLWLA